MIKTPHRERCGSATRQAGLLKQELRSLSPGIADAAKYQHVVLEILNFSFNPELIDGEPESRTIDGTERRDIIYTNDSSSTFWAYVRAQHSALFVMFETKNVQKITPAALNQTATYMGERLGSLAFIVTRFIPDKAVIRKSFAIYNDSNPRKVILFLSDQNLTAFLDLKMSGKNPTAEMLKLYRRFRTGVQ